MNSAPSRYGMIGQSSAMLKVFDGIERVCNSPRTVYISGETGVGKELVAKALHYSGKRENGPFVALNVTDFGDDELLEAKLFGIEGKVATGVVQRDGIFIQASKGTLFLDEISEMSPAMQSKLLRVLQERSVVPVGGSYDKPIPLDVRLVAASSQPLESYVKDKGFREDLYYRLRTVYIAVPSLSERKEDIPLLADAFLEKSNEVEGKNVKLSERTYHWLEDQPWKGNVRELKYAIEGAVAWTKKPVLDPKDFLLHKINNGGSAEKSHVEPSVSEARTMKDLDEEYIGMKKGLLLRALGVHNWNVTKAAKEIGVERSNFHTMIKRLGIQKPTL